MWYTVPADESVTGTKERRPGVKERKDTFGELLSMRQVAARLGVHPRTVRRWDAKGILPSLRLPSNHRRFRVADVDRLLESAEEERR